MPALEELQKQVLELSEQVQQLDSENKLLRAQIAWFKKQLFGSKSERFDDRQLAFALGLEKPENPPENKPEKIAYERRKPGARREPPAEAYKHLPVDETIEIISEEVKAAPDLYEEIGVEETFEVDVVPPRFFKRVIRRPKHRKKGDKTRPPVVAPAPKRPVEGSFASVGLLTYVMVGKYIDHLPLYRQEKIFARYGIKLSRKTMCDWVRIVAEWLKPIYDHMWKELVAGDYLQVDETPVRFQDKDFGNGKCRQGYLIGISRPGHDVLFSWSLTREHKNIHMAIKGFSGRLQCDAYGAYQSYARLYEEITLIGCWAHARRKFNDALEENPREASRILILIGHLYHREGVWKEECLNFEEIGRARQKKSKSTVRLLKRILKRLSRESLPKSNLGKACAYALNQWKTLEVFLDDGEVEIDNNLMENEIRPSAVGKKNWLFIGHPEAGDRSAILYSLAASCRRHGVDLSEYLRFALSRLPNATTGEIPYLTPKAFAETRQAVKEQKSA